MRNKTEIKNELKTDTNNFTDEEKWDKLFVGIDKFYLYTQEYPYHFESGLEMAEFKL